MGYRKSLKRRASLGPLLICPFTLLLAAQTITPSPRVLRFPEDRSLGRLQICDMKDWELGLYASEPYGNAMGNVTIPPNKAVSLNVSKESGLDFAPLASLGPNDLQMLSFQGTKVSDEDLQHIAGLTGLRRLNLSGTGVTDASLMHLSKLTQLERLNLWGTNITDEGLKHIAPFVSTLSKLQRLNLGQTPITDRGLAYLSRSTQLVELDLRNTDITDAGLVHLIPLIGLTSLTLSKTRVTDAGLRHVAKLSNLESLTIIDTSIGDAGMKYLAGHRKLRSLRLRGTKVGDAGIAHLASLPSLEELYIEDGRMFSDEALAHIGEIRSLRRLSLGSFGATDRGLANLINLSHLEYLYIGGHGITDVGMKDLAKLQSLKTLALQRCNVSDAGLAQLLRLRSFESLILGHTRVTGEGLVHLQYLPDLTTLHLFRVHFGKAGLRHLQPFSGLKILSIHGGRTLGDTDLAFLTGMKKLERLDLTYVTVTDTGMKHLSGLTSLQSLTISGGDVEITDEGLKYLGALRNLEHLDVGGSFTDHGLKHLAQLKSLRYVNFRSRTLSQEAIADWQAGLPSLQTVRTPRGRPVESPLQPGDIAPDFELKTLDGKTFRLRDHRGKVVLVYYWATWCAPCVASTPALKKFHDKLSKEHNRFVMVSLSRDRADYLPRRHAQRHKLTWPQARIGMDSAISDDYGVRSANMYFVIGPEGKIVSIDGDWDKIEAAVAEALVPSPAAAEAEGQDVTLQFLRSLRPDSLLDAPGTMGRSYADADIANGIKRILYFGEPWSAGKPLIDEETGYSVTITAGCLVTKDFVVLVGEYNSAMREHLRSH